MNRDYIITHVAVLATMTVVTYLVLPVAFTGKAEAPQQGIDIMGRTTVVDLLGIRKAQLPLYVRLAVTFARFGWLRVAVAVATIVVLAISIATRESSWVLWAIHAVLMWTMVLALWIESIAIFMCVG